MYGFDVSKGSRTAVDARTECDIILMMPTNSRLFTVFFFFRLL